MIPPAPATQPWAGGPNALGLTELEVASGVVLGSGPSQPWPLVDKEPLEVVLDEARDILRRGRCVVAFSGSGGSSAILAALLHVARRDGFDEPVAITARWPGDSATDESQWQEHVAAELSLKRWEVITPGTDFDLLGPLATRLLRRHGLLWPARVAALAPMVEAAGDGTLVTGEGGDEVFGTWGMARVWDRLRRPGGPSGPLVRQALRTFTASLLPDELRRRRARAGTCVYQTWLTSEARCAQEGALAADDVATDRLWWPNYLREVISERCLQLSAGALATLLRPGGGTFAAPLVAPTFLASLARRGGWLGLGDRASTMRAVFSPLLSETVLTRTSKATSGGVFWGPASRQFAEEWDGTGLDERWVHHEALRAAWRQAGPVYGAALPLHAAWLASNPGPAPASLR
jgi:asparagine synthase (glutamine-hydrolysing)